MLLAPMIAVMSALVVASVYFYVGRVVGRRRVSFEARTATTMFSVWWYALAILSVVSAATATLTVLEVTELAPYVALLYLAFAPLCVALAALLFYLVFLFTGSHRALMPIAAVYGVFYVYLLGLIAYYNPIGFHLQDTRMAWDFEKTSSQGVGVFLVVLMLVPHIIGAFAYASLYFRVEDRTQRYRIALVSGSIFVWFLSSFAASLAGVSRTAWWPYVSQIIGIMAALVILAAYRPPQWVRSKMRVEPVDLVETRSKVVLVES